MRYNTTNTPSPISTHHNTPHITPQRHTHHHPQTKKTKEWIDIEELYEQEDVEPKKTGKNIPFNQRRKTNATQSGQSSLYNHFKVLGKRKQKYRIQPPPPIPKKKSIQTTITGLRIVEEEENEKAYGDKWTSKGDRTLRLLFQNVNNPPISSVQ